MNDQEAMSACASQVWLADHRPYSRATCGKCHADLHVGKDGSLLIGDPPDMDKLYQEWKRDARQRAAQIPLRRSLHRPGGAPDPRAGLE